MNTTIAARSRLLRPYRSDALPQMGVVAAAASTYTVTTQERSPSPPRSPAIVGSAVAMIVWSSAAMNMTSSSPLNGSAKPRPLAAMIRASAAAPGCVLMATPPFQIAS